MTDPHGLFKQGERPAQVALPDGKQTDLVIRPHEATGMRYRLGNPEPVFSEGTARSERPQLGMAHGKGDTGSHSRDEELPEARAAPCPIEECNGRPEAVNRPTIVALSRVAQADIEVCQRLQDSIPTDRGEREGALGGGDRLVIGAHAAEMGGQQDGDLPQTTLIAEGGSEGLRLVQHRQDTLPVARRPGVPSAGRGGDQWPARACHAALADTAGH